MNLHADVISNGISDSSTFLIRDTLKIPLSPASDCPLPFLTIGISLTVLLSLFVSKVDSFRDSQILSNCSNFVTFRLLNVLFSDTGDANASKNNESLLEGVPKCCSRITILPPK